MKKILIAILLFAALAGCEKKSTLHLSGSKETIGAKVYIDSVFVTEIPEYRSSRSDYIGGKLDLEVEHGNHKFVAISKEGKRFEKKFFVKGEIYFSVSFKEPDTIKTDEYGGWTEDMLMNSLGRVEQGLNEDEFEEFEEEIVYQKVVGTDGIIRAPGILAINTSNELLQKEPDTVKIFNSDGSIFAALKCIKGYDAHFAKVEIEKMFGYYTDDHSIILFDSYTKEDDRYKVFVNDDWKYIKHIDDITTYETLEEHVINTILATDESNPVREKPDINAKTIGSFNYSEQDFHAIEIKGDWMKVTCENTCWQCPDDKVVEGWIRWKEGNKLLVKLYYRC